MKFSLYVNDLSFERFYLLPLLLEQFGFCDNFLVNIGVVSLEEIAIFGLLDAVDETSEGTGIFVTNLKEL